jgi:hypothetical protein
MPVHMALMAWLLDGGSSRTGLGWDGQIRLVVAGVAVGVDVDVGRM